MRQSGTDYFWLVMLQRCSNMKVNPENRPADVLKCGEGLSHLMIRDTDQLRNDFQKLEQGQIHLFLYSWLLLWTVTLQPQPLIDMLMHLLG